MNVIKNLIFNFPLICAGVGWFVAQMLKVLTGAFRERSFNLIDLFFGTGGMPSSHTAAVTSLTVACGLSEGLRSPAFAISCLLTLIVMRDATGVRREAGEQAKVLNRIMQDLFTSTDHDDIDRNLKELVGHTPLQVFVGFLLGLGVPFLMGLIPAYGIFF
ncbi:MAG: divergent PAP2 family protein [Ruminococcaceae bacterium]|nr:divergent PAP2 family protein [Oscillospiraceae bacterium]